MVKEEYNINCEYTKECKSFYPFSENGETIKCLKCRNNKYVDPESLKKDYYKPKFKEILPDIVALVVCVILIIFIFTTPEVC